MFFDESYSVVFPIYSLEEYEEFCKYVLEKTGVVVSLRIDFNENFKFQLVKVHPDFHRIHNTNITCAAFTHKKIGSLKKFLDWHENYYLVVRDLQVIAHFPHVSLEIPDDFRSEIFPLIERFEKYNLKMSDVGVDRLFKHHKDWIRIIPKYSRIYCDVERFKNDNLEPMAKFGQGYLYTKYYDGKDVFFSDKEMGHLTKQRTEYYDEHHDLLNNTTKRVLDMGKKVLILDIHSYSDELAEAIGKKGPFADVCIGFNEECFDQKILDIIIKEITSSGLTYELNHPYSGSIIPNDVLNGKIKGEVYSFMIEINKRVYL